MADADRQLPTETSPEHGVVVALDKPISLAEHWIEDDVHVIRSLEFDVIAGNEDFQLAVDQFAEKAEDLWGYLSKQESISDNENETFLLLADRFLEIYKELERREMKRLEAEQHQRLVSINLNRQRQRGEHFRNWRPQSLPNSASLPSLA
jgi:hypothetical protein